MIIYPTNCSICQKKIQNFNSLSKHLKKNHGIDFSNWYVENYYNNIWPKCFEQNCSNKVKFSNGKFRKFCSLRCRTISTNKSDIGRNANKKSWTKERREKHSEKLKSIYQNNIELKNRISSSVKNAMTEDVKNIISYQVCKSITIENASKNNIYNSIKGYKKNGLQNLNYKNNYELQAFKTLDSNAWVIKWFYEGIIIKLDNGKHTVVDLEVYYNDGTKKIIEIRHKDFPDKEFSRLKAIQDYCNENNYIFEIWTEKEVEENKSIEENKNIWGIF